jgi:hypothetical protein
MKKQNETRQPFFSRFLESQELSRVQGGGDYQTLKYPSDTDEEQTMKYPSDSDEASDV